MDTQRSDDESAIENRVDELVEAIRTADLERLRTCFAADIVSFDVGPPLQHVGAEAKLNNWRVAFTVLQPPLGYEIRDLMITAGEGVAFAHGFGRLSGTLNGNQFGPWVRWTAGLRKIDGTWLIAHDQVSIPIDLASGMALSTLTPDNSMV